MFAELDSIGWGLLMAVEQDYINVLNETDPEVASNLVRTIPDDHPLRVLLRDCNGLLNICNGQVSHTKREGDQCADILANIG